MREFSLAPRYAHRGYYENPLIPENSMAAFRRAREHGFSVEFDVHRIADGSLVIFHDDELERMTGVKGQIEDYDITNLRELRLAGTDEQIPTFDELLDLYEDSGLQLLVELKPNASKGNYRELAEAVCRRLDSYKGDFVVESFDPRALLTVKKIRPDFIRGQLVQDFFLTPDNVKPYEAVLLTNLAFNPLVKPDFMAYRISDKVRPSLRRALDRQHLPAAVWTVKTPDDYRTVVSEGRSPIFEGFDPDKIDD